MTTLRIKSIKDDNEIGKLVVNFLKVDEKILVDLYKLILRSFPVNVISDEEHTIFELDAKFCKDNIKFKNIEPFIKRHWQDSDKFLFIYETKHFTKSVLGKAFPKSA